MDLFNLVAKLTLDSSEYDRAMAAAKGTAVSSGNSMVQSVNKTKKAIGVAAIGMTAAIGAFGISSVRTGMEFDSAMSQVAATMGKTMDDLANETGTVDLAWGKFTGNLREYAQEMGKNTKFSATEAAEALNYMALAGYDTQKSMEMLPPVLNLAAAGNMELATASDMVTDASSALSLSQEETVEMVDQMAMAASKSNTSVEQLGQAFLTVGGTAKVLKGGTTELSAALGILADNGTKGAEGGTALRNILTSIQGDKFENTFGALGVQAYDAEGNLRSLNDVVGDMNVALEGMTDEEKTDIINKVFNARDLKNVNALLGTSADRWDELTGAIEDSEGAAQKMADTQLDNLAGDITLLKSAFEGLKISISDELTPAFREIVQGITWCIDHASILGPIILGLATAFGTFAVAINIGPIIKLVKSKFIDLFLTLTGNPIGLLVAAIAGLVVAFIALYKNNEDFRNKVLELWSALKVELAPIIESLKEIFKACFEIFETIIIPLVTKAMEILKKAFTAALPVIQRLAKMFSGPLISAVSAVLSHFARMATSMASSLNKAKSIASSAAEAIKNNIITPLASAASNAIATFEEIKNGISDKIESAKEKVSSVIDTIKGFFPFSIGKIFSFTLPSISIGSQSKTVGGKSVTGPTFDVGWRHFAKAMDTPYMFTKPTIFDVAGDAGDEIMYGRRNLMRDINEATSDNSGGTINIYLNYDASTDASDMVRDIAKGVKRYRMAGAM